MFKLHFTSAFLLMDISKSLVVELILVSYKTQTLSYILSKEYKSIKFSLITYHICQDKNIPLRTAIYTAVYTIFIS